MKQLTTAQILRDTLAAELQRDSSVFIMGEDIAAYGGSFGVTRGLIDEFGPLRIRNTPISEAGFVGAAIGAAAAGARPVVEIMFMDFIALAADQIINMAAKLHYIYGATCPLVIRTPLGAGRGYGATHSQCLERLFFGVPGLKIVAPGNGADFSALLQSSIADPNPVLFLEHKLLYPLRWDIPEVPAVPRPLGEARVSRPGTDISIIAWSYMTVEANRAAALLAEEEIEAEVIDVATLLPLDIKTIITSAVKTKRVLIVEEGPLTGGIAAEISAQIHERLYGQLDFAVTRLAMPDSPIPSARPLELHLMPNAETIAAAALDIATRV